MRLRPGLRVLRRATDEVQIGTDPRWAVRLTGLTVPEVRALTALDGGGVLPRMERLTARVDEDGRPCDAVVDLLRQAGLVLDAAPQRSAASVPPLPSGALADAAAWSLVLDDHDGGGGALVRARADRVVGFLGAGRLALTAATTLASAGVGTVLLDDPSPVTTRDLGAGGLSARDVGSPRAEAAARLLRDLVPEVRTSAAERTRPDVVVSVEHAVADAARARAMMAAEVVHLSVVVREGDVLVGPLVRPGSSPCLRCLDLHRTAADPAWPVVAAQLAASPRQRAVAEESVLAVVGGGLAAAAVLAQLDGRPPAVVAASLEIALPDVVPRLRRWPVHPDCGCTGLPAAGVGRPAAGPTGS
ncbi:ThiF family adenylyltransferase [Cellulomonas aerilata]|uniref:ThiF family adenylyltransferase n=1 Tax=Cellulomonas aerilata TaxID=515326 RepID=UPI0011BEAE03|nr:ThiF family adenylyltransferase [Cellulomonas aerilata]